MSKGLAAGDSVRLVERTQTSADIKSYLYYPHYAGLTGIIGKVYPDNTASVNIDLDSLPPAIRKRHENTTAQMRQKWLDSLSDEARNRLSAAEKKLTLRYAILVSADDATPEERPAIAAAAPKKSDAVAKVESAAQTALSEPSRKTLEELEAEEAQHLAEIAKRKAQDPTLEF
jgi:hypothetical protein